MRIVAILQARLGSTRLPGKVLLPLAGTPMLQHIIERVQRASRLHGVALAVPHEDRAQFEGMGCGIVSDDRIKENDLVGRYRAAAEVCEADVIVRVPCDNPCIDPAYIDAAVKAYLRDPFIYYSNTTDECDGKLIDGIGAEVVSMSRLRWLDARTQGHAIWREHPHRFFEDAGLLHLPPADYRLDVNTQADYEFIQSIYDHFGNNRFTTQQVVSYLTTQGVCT